MNKHAVLYWYAALEETSDKNTEMIKTEHHRKAIENTLKQLLLIKIK